MKKIIFSVSIILTVGLYAQNKTGSSPEIVNHVDKKFFIENKGQWHSDVLYLCRMGGLDAWITKYGVSYNFYKREEIASSFVRQKPQSKVNFDHLEKEYRLIGHGIVFKHHNHNTYINCEGLQKQEGYYNYFIGNDPTKHATNIALYKEAIVKNVYNGIDLHYYFDRGFLRYDYIVYPGADPSQITFSIQGSDNIYLNAKGDLVFTTRFGEVAVSELKTYQAKNKKEVANKFIKKGFAWGISLGSYDTSQPLIIDPLIYSTYIGGVLNDIGRDIAVDVNGNAYLTGWTSSANFPITPGAYQTTKGTDEDVFVTKLNAAGNGLVYSTFLGGNGNEKGFGIAIDGSGNAYVSGETSSNNFPTLSAYQSNYGGVVDAFITKLNASGNALLYSTFLGGSSDEGARRIAVDGSGNAYISGYSQSINFPTTAGAYQTIKSDGYDAFVTKINTAGNSLGYSTFLGGNGVDASQAIAIDGNSNAYVTGRTTSNNFPITSGAYQTINDGSYDVFVTKLNASGSGLLYSTYIGGNANEDAFGIAVDGSGSAYVTGHTNSTNYDVTTGAFQTTIGGGDDVFVTKLNPTGTTLVYSTFIGGNSDDLGRSIAVDNSGNAYITGYTNSNNYYITTGAFQTLNGGFRDAFVTKLNITGTSLIYSTFLGGNFVDEGHGIAIDLSGYAYVMGNTQSTDFDITTGTLQNTLIGGWDVFVTKLCPLGITLSSSSGTDNQTVCINNAITNITYSSSGATGATFSGLPTGVTGNYSGGDITISGTPTDTGTFNYTVILTGGCGTITATGTIVVNICTAIKEVSSASAWLIFPNPSSGTFTLQSEKGGSFELTDLTGKVLRTYEVHASKYTIQENLPAGMYFIRETSRGVTQKLIIE